MIQVAPPQVAKGLTAYLEAWKASQAEVRQSLTRRFRAPGSRLADRAVHRFMMRSMLLDRARAGARQRSTVTDGLGPPSHVKRYVFARRTLATSAGRKHATQLPPACRTLG